jgi:transketolase
MRNHLISTLDHRATSDPMLFFLTGDLGYGVIENFSQNHPRQFLNTGIAEQAMTGIAAGLAASGYKPWIYSIANFPTFRCLEQIRNDICYHNLDVTIVAIGSGFSYGTLGYSHFGIEDLSVMQSLPGMRVFCPASVLELDTILEECFQTVGPKYLRIDKSVGVTHKPLSAPRDSVWTYKRTPNSKISLLTSGTILDEAMRAAAILEGYKISVEVFSLPFFQSSCLPKSVLENRDVFTIEEHSLKGGLFTLVSEVLAEGSIRARLHGIGVRQEKLKVTGSQEFLRKVHGIDGSGIALHVLSRLNDVEPPSGIEPETFALRERRSTD